MSNYLGMLNEVAIGLKIRPDRVVQMPPELKKYRQMEVTGLPIWEGGLQDQPHIWLEMMGVIAHIIKVFENLAKANRPQEK
jgi:hypothetical protein